MCEEDKTKDHEIDLTALSDTGFDTTNLLKIIKGTEDKHE